MANIEKLVGSESRLELGQKINEIIEGKANKDLTNTGKITNCITEIPQRINLELNNGTLTLKAGSEVIVPNGFEADGVTPKFDYVTIESDVNGDTGTGDYVYIYKQSINSFGATPKASCVSGDTTPTTPISHMFWYDTVNNIMKRYIDGAWVGGYSLPVCISSNTTIYQIFNGMGYIGSTVWVDKGVKGLIPNGRNGDGTCTNLEWESGKLTIVKDFYNDGNCLIVNNDSILHSCYRGKYTTPPSLGGSNGCYYNCTESCWYINNGHSWTRSKILVLGNISGTNVSTLTPKLPFRAVDYNEYKDFTNIAMSVPDYNKIIQVSHTGYSCASKGYILFKTFILARDANFYVNINNVTIMHSQNNLTNASRYGGLMFPVNQGDTISASGTDNIEMFFIPAKGA